MRDAAQRNDELGLSDDEVAFYDALAMKISLRLLFGFIAFIAVGTTSLLNANVIWFQVLLTATVLIL